MNKIYDSIIVGAGPAGITAAIYLKRAELEVAVIEKEIPGGQVNKTSIVENYPGFKSITGPDLAEKFYEQIENLKIETIFSEVEEIIDDEIKTIKLKNGKELKTKSIILAIGRSPKRLESENSRTLEGKGISFCSLCDGALYKGEDVSIVGAGNSALEEAIYLSKICKSVTILCKTPDLRGEKVTVKEVKKIKNINIIYNSSVEKFNESNGVLESIEIKVNGKKDIIKTKACFIFIGYEPATNFLKPLEILDEKGYIMVDEFLRTKKKGIYAAGDVVKKDAFQIVTATSDGARAAITCTKDLSEMVE